MTFVAAAIGAAAVVGGAAIAANASGDAADTQAQGARDANASQERMLERQIEVQQPWLNAGENALQKIRRRLGIAPVPMNAEQLRAELLPRFQTPGQGNGVDDAGLQAAIQQRLQQQATESANVGNVSPYHDFGMADFQADPGYAFRQSEQTNALNRAAQVGRGVGSGSYLKDAMKYSGNLASQEFGNAYNRFTNNNATEYNRLAGVAGIGQTAANTTGAAMGTTGAQIGANITGGANAQAAGQVGTANAINSGIGQGVSMYQTNRLLDLYGAGRGVTPPNPYAGGGYVLPASSAPLMDWYS